MRLLGAVASGWLADRIGRKTPLMISILWYSLANFIAGFSPSYWFLFLFRTLLGIGMGAEWPAGAALAMETWPARSRGFMGGILQGSWGIGFLLSSVVYGLFFNYIGWRGMLWIGVLPAVVVLFVTSRSPKSGRRIGGGMQGQMPPYLAERFPTEVRATASAFCFHQGAIWGGLVPLVLSFFAVQYDLGFAIPMMVGTCVGRSASPAHCFSARRPRERYWCRICRLRERLGRSGYVPPPRKI